MAKIPILGKLEKVEPKAVWEHEAHSFTPWLAKPENLEILGDAIGMELELEAVEQNVGPFRADILCKQIGSGHWVLIENQLDRTDHSHLGQLMTYAAGLEAVSLIWISPIFTDEHRAALDWLNRSTIEGLNFFGVQLEVWRIGDSEKAPRFNVVSKPNQWTKAVAGTSAAINATGFGQLYLEYWTAFFERLNGAPGDLKPGTAPTENFIVFSPFGRSGFVLSAAVSAQKKLIRVGMYIQPKEADLYFQALRLHREEIESKLGPLEWHDKANQERAVRYVMLRTDPANKNDWNRQHDWIIKKLYALYEVLGPYIRDLKLPGNGAAD